MAWCQPEQLSMYSTGADEATLDAPQSLMGAKRQAVQHGAVDVAALDSAVLHDVPGQFGADRGCLRPR